jgi:SAM-dependent methyltransferase
MTCSSLRGQLRPPQPDATAILTVVKAFRPRFRGERSTLTTASDRKARQPPWEQPLRLSRRLHLVCMAALSTGRMAKTTMKTLPARVRWAVHLLDPRPQDQILEVGGGPGLAAALICERLTAGRLLMNDRSAVAVGQAARRNAIHLLSGRLVVQQSTLAALTVPPLSFDKALTINVNLFWAANPARELAVLRQALRPGGVLHVVYGAGGPTAAERIARPVAATLAEHGFTSISVTTASAGFAITGRAAPPA